MFLTVLELSVNQAGLKLNRDPPASASCVLGLKVCATTLGKTQFFKHLRKIVQYWSFVVPIDTSGLIKCS